MEGMDSTKPRHMPYKLLEEITGGFSGENMLGSGGFGDVYKGVDKDGQEIAVKMLKSIDLDDKEFRKEMDNISGLKHSNIVQLVGFCSEDEEEYIQHNGKHVPAVRMRRALCFEYMQNGSLEKHVSDEHKGLSWQARYRIIKGICEGLKYLHTGLPSPICHLDLKPANILLDGKMAPKIADFGLSRLIIGDENTKRTANLKGSLKYMPPEFIKYNLTSKEYDIYSLGVIIIMIMVGPRVYSLISDMKPAQFAELVHKKWRERLQEISEYISFEADCEQVKKCIEIASQCIEEKQCRRPSIEHIVDLLLSKTEKYQNDITSGTEEVVTLELKSTERRPLENVPYDFLKEITDNFSPERQLGEDPFGTMYKGVQPDGLVIVVEKLAEDTKIIPHEKKFTNVLGKLVALRHENIVKLVGFCFDTGKKVVEHNGKYIIVDTTKVLFCYEYLARGSLDRHISSKSNTALDWDTRFEIIRGICNVLHFLHREFETPLIHRSITSSNIFLDDNWMPKIGNFYLSTLLDRGQTRNCTQDVVGPIGYLAPEYVYRGEISTATDMYSLGVLIIQITTGEKLYPNVEDKCGTKFIEQVRDVWTKLDHIVSEYSFFDARRLHEVKLCIDIGFRCVEFERRKRPSISALVNMLHIREETLQITRPISPKLLDIYPPQLHFAFTPNKSISCSLQLTNKSHDCIAVRLQSDSKRYKMPLFGIVPPHSTYTLVVTTRKRKKALPNNSESLTLESIIVREGDLSMKHTDADSAILEYINIFKKAREMDASNVHDLMVPVVCVPPGSTSSQPLLSEVEIISNDFAHVLSVDVHPTKPWIMTSHYGGNVVIWNYKKQETENIFEITTGPVYSTKFIERERLLVAGDSNGTIYIYNYYYTEKEVRSIEEAHDSDITSLDVHPTEHFVLSSSDDHLIKLWDWENGWECCRSFVGHSDRVTQVNFIPTDPKCFASASLDHTIRIWDISSSESKMILCDHPDVLLCVHSYINNNRKYLISGFGDGSAQVWDVEEERCVQTFEGHLNRVSSVCSLPELDVVVTGSYDGTVRVWDSTYRLENIIGVNLGAVYALGYIDSLERLVIGCYQGIAIVGL